MLSTSTEVVALVVVALFFSRGRSIIGAAVVARFVPTVVAAVVATESAEASDVATDASVGWGFVSIDHLVLYLLATGELSSKRKHHRNLILDNSKQVKGAE